MDAVGQAPTVPGWQVVRELGRGGSSTVWLVTNAAGGEAALKVPDRRTEEPAELLDIELRAVGELRHEHVVRPLGVVATDQGPGLLSEYHAGGSLGGLVRAGGPLPVGQVVTVLVPVAQALQALHGNGVVHGDLSPGNIVFTVQGRPAVADLGSSRLLGGPAARAGTPGFMAPELAVGPDGPERDGAPDRALAPAADVYSLAAVGWYALTGRAPARTASRAPLPLVVTDVPAEVAALLEAGLDEDPDARPSAERFATACYRWATPEPVDLHPSASPEVAMELPTRRRAQPRRRRSPRWPALLAAGAGLVLVVTGGAAVGLVPVPWASPGAGPVARPTPPTSAVAPSSAAPSSAARSSAAPSSVLPSAQPTDSGPGRAAAPLPGLDATNVTEAATALGPARAVALTSLERRDVDGYSLPGSPAHQDDLQLLTDLRDRGLRYAGLGLRTEVIGPAEPLGAHEARVPLTLTISPYRIVTTDGQTVDEVSAPAVETLTAELVRTEAGWRVQRIVAGQDGDGQDADGQDADGQDADGQDAGGS